MKNKIIVDLDTIFDIDIDILKQFYNNGRKIEDYKITIENQSPLYELIHGYDLVRFVSIYIRGKMDLSITNTLDGNIELVANNLFCIEENKERKLLSFY